jgi:hypothetical protein
MDGELVMSPGQLVTSGCYVAANKERFKRCEYYPASSDFSPRINRKA